tara:strand:- start:303 stop:683 length:381 start_codon:yes stop_codon:yes gene_type:complete
MHRIFIIICGLLIAHNICANSHHPQTFLKEIAGSKDEGHKIVQHYCINCHAPKPLIPLGAPRIGYSDDWIPRLKQGIDALFKNTDEGLNAMPARGGCFECTDKQLMLAILSMLPEQQQKALSKHLK